MYRLFLCYCLILLLCKETIAQNSSFVPNAKYDSLRIMLVGDLSQSNGQISNAYDNINKYYDYSNTFKYVQPLFGVSDIVIGNLETTFSGKPFSGSQNFSAPDQFALALKFAGINCLMTANDHCADRDQEGMLRTLHVLDSFGIRHTGTFANKENKFLNNPLLITRNGFTVAVLNYTFGTRFNVLDTNMVNLINREKIRRDLFETTKLNPDFTIVYLHWGTEYERFASDEQKDLAKLCFDFGADFVAGSNPHVLQKTEELQFYSYGQLTKGFVAYSLGNFLSDYDRRYGDGGAIMEIILSKEKKTGITKVSDYGFIPTYVIKDDGKGNKPIQVVPVSEVESKHISVDISASDIEKMRISALDSRTMMTTNICQESKYKLNDDIINDVAETIMLTGAPVNTDKKNEFTFVQKKPIIKSNPAVTLPTKTDTSIVAKTLIPKATENIVESKTTNVRAIDSKNNSNNPTLVNKVIVPPINPVISREEHVKDSIVEANKAAITSINSIPSTPNIKTTSIVVSKIDKVSTKDSVLKSEPVLSSAEPIIIPVERTIEDDINDLEEKFKKYGTISYKVQFYNMPNKIEINTYYYKYLEGYESVQDAGNWVYYLGNSTSFDEAKARCLMLRSRGLKNVIIVPFVNGKKIEWTIRF